VGLDQRDPRAAGRTQPGIVPVPQRPPKPLRPRAAPVAEDDDTTMRVLAEEYAELREAARPPQESQRDEPMPWPGIEGASYVGPRAAEPEQELPTIRPGAPDGAMPVPLPAPPPLPNLSQSGEQTSAAAGEAPKQAAARFPAREQHLKIAAAIFVAGVLVGVIATAAVTSSRAVQTPEPAAPSAPAAALPLPVSAPVPAAASKHVEPKPNVASASRTEVPRRETGALPISISNAPSCGQLLGAGVVERDAPQAALRETRLANRELRRGNVPEAQAAYCKAFEWDRANVDRHVNLGRLFLVRRDWEKAAEYGQSALELDPKSRPALGVVGDAWAALHKPEEARAAWLEAEKKPNPSADDLRLIIRRSMALAQRVERLKDYSLAERIYRRVLLFSPEHTGATKGIARCLLKVGDRQAADAWAKRAQAPK